MNEEQNNISEVDLDAFRARLMELKGQHEAIEREMDSIQSQMEGTGADRSEERRVGKECRSRWSPYH